MKKVIISSFIILILIGFYAVRRYHILPRSYHEDPLTTIQIEQNVFDFDTIEFKNDVYCNFKITNTGNHPLVIKFVEVSCGCTVPEFGKKPIAKDSTITIRVNYHPMKPGQFFEKIFVFCNSKNSPHFLNIKGFVLPSDTLNQPN